MAEPDEDIEELCTSDDIVLLRHLEGGEGPVALIVDGALPRWAGRLPRARVVRGELAGVPAGSAVLTLAPDRATGIRAELRQLGFRVALFRTPGGWLCEDPPASAHPAPAVRAFRLPRFRWSRFAPDGGRCYRAAAPHLRRACARLAEPEVVVLEDGRLLPHGDAPHAEIRALGGGRYSFWESTVFLSASDGTDPNANGRCYQAVIRAAQPEGGGWTCLAPPYSDEPAFRRAFRAMIEAKAAAPPVPATPSVCMVIGSLWPGGSERQLAMLAIGLRRRGHDVAVATLTGLCGDAAHYRSWLAENDVRVVSCTTPTEGYDFPPPPGGWSGELGALLASLPQPFKLEVWRLYTHLCEMRPDVVHCFLDQPNLIGAIAARLADVPRIVLSVRNYNPTNFSYLDRPWLRPWYAALRGATRVRFSGNAGACCADYEQWLGWPAGSFAVVPNGLDPDSLRPAAAGAVADFRREHGLDPDTPVVLGVFRLSEEKQPLVFVDVVAELRRAFPGLRAFHAGVGDLEEAVRTRIAELGLGDALTLLGRCEDLGLLYEVAQVVLLTSSREGVPNVALEAQWFARPVVCTAVGGSAEAVRDGETGFVVDASDRAGLAARTAELLRDPQLRARLGSAGRAHVEREYSLPRLVERSLALYS